MGLPLGSFSVPEAPGEVIRGGFCLSRSGVSPFLAGAQVMLILLICGPQLEKI